MSITPRGMSVQEAYRLYREGKLIVNRKYQRKLVWSLDEKKSLIDSMIKDYPVPLILFAEVATGVNPVYEIMDGMQRLNAIFSFIETAFSIEEQYFNLAEFARAKQAAEAGLFTPIDATTVKLLSQDICANFLDYQLAVTIFPFANDEQVTDVFGRINSGGRQLSWQEKRQAGVIDNFSSLVRKLASEIRGDISREKLPLSDMPEISIDSSRMSLGYNLKAEEIFWCKQGILWVKSLKDSEDEEEIADICASVVLGEPIPRSRVYFDAIYDQNTPQYEVLQTALARYGADKLYEEVKVTLSVLREVIEGYNPSKNALRSTINPTNSNEIKASFYALFMSFFQLVIKEERSPENVEGIMLSLQGLQAKMTVTGNYSKVEDRNRNIDMTIGLIQKFFVKKDPPMLRHGAGLALDLENALRRSRIETSRYECKQGIIQLSDERKEDENLPEKIINTICAIANVGPDADGFIFIGVADKKADADRIQEIDGVEATLVGNRYIVGVEREFALLGLQEEQYVNKILQIIKTSQLSEPLKSSVISQVDYVEYKGSSVIRMCIPAQKAMSFVGDKAFIREGAKTLEAQGPSIIAINDRFRK